MKGVIPKTEASVEIEIDARAAAERLDAALTARLVALGMPISRTRVRALIEAGHVRAAGGGATLVEPSRRVKPRERYLITIPAPEPPEPVGQALPLLIVYEDDDLIVIDKPAGLVVHPAPGNPDLTLVNALIAHCGESLSGIGGVARPGIVHRLDKDTSGLMVAAKTDQAHAGLAAQFAAHGRDGRLERAYQAFIWGALSPRAGRIAGAIGRKPNNRKAFAVVPQGGKPAVTHFRTLATYGTPPVASLVECRLETGRTHQIRVHLAHLGHGILGDPVYGGRRSGANPKALAAARALGRQALHATLLGFLHPRSGERLTFTSPLPPTLKRLSQELEQL